MRNAVASSMPPSSVSRSSGASIVHAELPPIVLTASDVERTILGFELLNELREFLQNGATEDRLDELVSQAAPTSQGYWPEAAIPGRGANTGRRSGRCSRFAPRNASTTGLTDSMRSHSRRPSCPPFPRGSRQGDDRRSGRRALHRHRPRHHAPGSLGGLSCLVLPAGMTRSGLPVGMGFDALPGADRQLLALGLSIEKALGPVPAPSVQA